MAVSRVLRGPRLSENGQLYDVLGAFPSPRAASAPSFHSYCTAPAAWAAPSAEGGVQLNVMTGPVGPGVKTLQGSRILRT